MRITLEGGTTFQPEGGRYKPLTTPNNQSGRQYLFKCISKLTWRVSNHSSIPLSYTGFAVSTAHKLKSSSLSDMKQIIDKKPTQVIPTAPPGPNTQNLAISEINGTQSQVFITQNSLVLELQAAAIGKHGLSSSKSCGFICRAPHRTAEISPA